MSVAHVLLGEALLLRAALSNFASLAAEVLLLDLREPLVDVLVGDLDAELRRPPAANWLLLDEELDRLLLSVVVLGRAGLRELSARCALKLACALLEQLVELGLRGSARRRRPRSRRPEPSRASPPPHAGGEPAAQRREQRAIEENGGGSKRHFGKKGPRQAACRDGEDSIDQLERRREYRRPSGTTSRLARGVDGGVEPSRSSRSSSEPRTSGPTVALPPRKTR